MTFSLPSPLSLLKLPNNVAPTPPYKLHTTHNSSVRSDEGLTLEMSVPIENEESKPKNNSQSYNSNFIRSEIKLIVTKIQVTKRNHIINRWN